MGEFVDGGRGMTSQAARRRRPRTAAVLATALLTLALGACDALPRPPGGGPAAPSTAAAPMDPEAVAAADPAPVDPSWLCRPGEVDPPATSSDDGGVLTPRAVRTDGNDVQVSGPFRLEDDHRYQGVAPEGVLLPADPEHRGRPAPGFEGELGVAGAPVPPMVVRARVEIPGEGAAPSAVTARLTLGTCDDSPLPDGQFLLRLSGGGVDGPGRGKDAGWRADGDVLVDVVDGRLRAVPGAVTAPSGEVPVDLSALACRTQLTPQGDGDGVSVQVTDPATSVSTAVPEDAIGAGITGAVTVSSQDLGTRALLQGIVLTDPRTGTVVAGARNASAISLQWIDEDGVTRSTQAWTTRAGCGRGALDPGAYRAHGFAATVDAEGATHVILSDPWDVEVVEPEPAA
jgi:hypothetical protein